MFFKYCYTCNIVKYFYTLVIYVNKCMNITERNKLIGFGKVNLHIGKLMSLLPIKSILEGGVFEV